MTPKRDKIIIWIFVGPLLAYIGIGLKVLIIFFISIFSPTPQFKRNEMTEYYRNSEYLTLYGKIDDYYSYDDGATFTFKLDEECIRSLTEEQLRSFSDNGIYLECAIYEFTPKCKEVLRENGFFDLLKTNGNGDFYSEETITFIVNNKAWHHDDTSYAVGLSVGETVYLDFETGKELLIDYIQHDMH